MADLGSRGTAGSVKYTKAVQFNVIIPILRTIVCGDARMFRGQKSTSDGDPAQPSLEMTVAGKFRFRWRVASGTRTISVKVKNPTGLSPYPILRVKANPDIGVNSDVTGTAIGGTGWQTIGPVTITPSADGAVWVELDCPQVTNNERLCRWDFISVT
jgi:hypothetical protein